MGALRPFVDKTKFSKQADEARVLELRHQFALEIIHAAVIESENTW